MKKIVVLSACSFFIITLKAQVYWDGGGGDGQWSTAANWSADIMPDSTSNVVLDNSVITAGYTVLLPAGDISTRVNSLTITPATGQVITLILPPTNTSINGFLATGAGDAVVLNNGAILRNSSGAPAGTPVSVRSTNFFRINNGGRYIHNTPRIHTDFLISRLSVAPGTEDGVFEFDVPSTASYTISVSNRTYGHLILSANAAGGSKTYSASGLNPCLIRGNLEINTNAILSYGANTDTFIIKKNCIIYPGGVFNISNSTNNATVRLQGHLDIQGTLTESGTSAGSALWLNGTTPQSLNVNGNMVNTIDVNLDNPAGAELLSPLLLPYRLTITNGNLLLRNHDLATPAINQVNPATPSNNHIVTNGTGLLRVPVVNNMVLPVGPDQAHYNPVHITNGAGAAYAIRVDTGIHPAISNPFPAAVNRTWTINTSLTPGNAAAMKFGFYASDWLNSFDPGLPADLGQWISGGWSVARSNLPVVNTGGDPMYEVPFDNVPIYNSTFIIGNRSFGLPLDFYITCSAQKIDRAASIRWSTNDENSVNHFELQRSVNGSGFRTIAAIFPIVNQREYRYDDNVLLSGRPLYRVKAKLIAGGERYSNTATINHSLTHLLISDPVPNPATSKTMLRVRSPRACQMEMELINMEGKMVKRWNQHIYTGDTVIEIMLDKLPAGIYLLKNNEGSNTIRIIKQ